MIWLDFILLVKSCWYWCACHKKHFVHYNSTKL